MSDRKQFGTQIASLWVHRTRQTLFGLLLLNAMGCLVTNVIELPEQPNYPPSIVVISPPQDQILVVDLTQDTQVTLEIAVRDINVRQDIEYLVFANFNPTLGSPMIASGLIEASSTADEGNFERLKKIDFDASLLGEPGTCAKIEVLVSGRFSGTNFRRPVTTGDIDTAVWWADVRDGESSASLGSCR